jgi:hypothetical protein
MDPIPLKFKKQNTGNPWIHAISKLLDNKYAIQLTARQIPLKKVL